MSSITIVAVGVAGVLIGGFAVVMAGGVRLAWRRDDERPRPPAERRQTQSAAAPTTATHPVPAERPAGPQTIVFNGPVHQVVTNGGQGVYAAASREALAAHEAGVITRRPVAEVEAPR